MHTLKKQQQEYRHLGSNAEVWVWHKLRGIMGMGLHLHVSICHADTHTWQGQYEGQDLPGPSCV